jgi:hypothetical protein
MALQTLGKMDTTETYYKDVTYDMASLNATTAADLAITVPDVVAGVDEVSCVIPGVALNAGLQVVSAHVSADKTVTVRVYNTTAGALDPASTTWRFIMQRFGKP